MHEMTTVLSLWQWALLGLGAVAGGMVNALAGGGTLITFPLLTAMGIPAVAANVTNTVALCPGYLAGTFAQAGDLRGQKRRLWRVLPVATLGGMGGGILLLWTGEQLFREMVPWLILFAAGLLALQGRLRAWLVGRTEHLDQLVPHEMRAMILLVPATVYCGYFGAGAGVIILAVLGLVMEDSITRLNALKQSISFASNVAAAVCFLFSGKTEWWVALLMAAGAILGGTLGGRLAGRVRPTVLRWIVVAVGVVVAGVYFARGR